MGFKAKSWVFITSSAFLILAVLVMSKVTTEFREEQSLAVQVIYGIGASAFMLGFILCVDIYLLNPADSHSLYTLYTQYRYLLLLRMKRPYMKWWINKKLMDPKKESEAALIHILRRNQNSVYGKEYKFAQITSREDFVRMHPLTSQEHYKPYVDRIMNGEVNVLSPDKTAALVQTSGTTGTSKIYSFTEHFLQIVELLRSELYSATFALQHTNLQRFMRFLIFSTPKKSTSKIPIVGGSQLTLHFPPHNLIPSPYSKLYAEDSSYYAQGVFSLAERELQHIMGFSADLMYSYWKFITTHWENMCEDISRGEIGHHVDMPEEVRLELSSLLPADPARAAELRKAMKSGVVGLVKRIWPSFEFISMGKGAGFKMSADLLMANQFKGVKVFDLMHTATEGLNGVNLTSDRFHIDDAFTLILFSVFFLEFIPLMEVDKEEPMTDFPEDLKVGEMYEIVMTNINGLYRVRYGDIIKVVGFNKNTPKYEFVYKLGQRLNIAYDRTPDKFLTAALQEQEHSLPSNSHIVDFTTTESVVIEQFTGNTSKGHYVFFVEFNTDKPINETELSEKVDCTLMDMYEQYKRFKDIESIGPLELIQVKCGTFDGLKKYIWNDTPHGQFKMPRVLRREPALRYLLENAVQPQDVST